MSAPSNIGRSSAPIDLTADSSDEDEVVFDRATRTARVGFVATGPNAIAGPSRTTRTGSGPARQRVSNEEAQRTLQRRPLDANIDAIEVNATLARREASLRALTLDRDALRERNARRWGQSLTDDEEEEAARSRRGNRPRPNIRPGGAILRRGDQIVTFRPAPGPGSEEDDPNFSPSGDDSEQDPVHPNGRDQNEDEIRMPRYGRTRINDRGRLDDILVATGRPAAAGTRDVQGESQDQRRYREGLEARLRDPAYARARAGNNIRSRPRLEEAAIAAAAVGGGAGPVAYTADHPAERLGREERRANLYRRLMGGLGPEGAGHLFGLGGGLGALFDGMANFVGMGGGRNGVAGAGAGGGGMNEGMPDVPAIIASVPLNPYPTAIPSTHITHEFDMDAKAPIEVDADGSFAESLPPFLGCISCGKKLLLSSAYRDEDDRVWSLRCGHLIHQSCLTDLSTPTASEMDRILPADLHVLGESADEDHFHPKKRRRGNTRSTAMEKKKKEEATREWEWLCPVKGCGMGHVSIQKNGQDWTQRPGMGGIQVYM